MLGCNPGIGSGNQALSFSVKIPGKRTIIRQKFGKPGFNCAVVLFGFMSIRPTRLFAIITSWL